MGFANSMKLRNVEFVLCMLSEITAPRRINRNKFVFARCNVCCIKCAICEIALI